MSESIQKIPFHNSACQTRPIPEIIEAAVGQCETLLELFFLFTFSRLTGSFSNTAGSSSSSLAENFLERSKLRANRPEWLSHYSLA